MNKVTHRAKQICRKPGCTNLLDSPGYCPEHTIHTKEKRFEQLKKAEGSKEFYGSYKWKKTRATYRRDNPLCEPCKAKGKIVKAKVVDHKTERNDIIAAGGDPCDPKHLQSMCTSCHQSKLVSRRWKHKAKTKQHTIYDLRKKRVGGW